MARPLVKMEMELPFLARSAGKTALYGTLIPVRTCGGKAAVESPVRRIEKLPDDQIDGGRILRDREKGRPKSKGIPPGLKGNIPAPLDPQEPPHPGRSFHTELLRVSGKRACHLDCEGGQARRPEIPARATDTLC